MLDMDGVLTDYDNWLDFHNARKENGKSDWKKLEKIGSSYWSEMPWNVEGHKLYNKLQEFLKDRKDIELGILSAVYLFCGKRGKKYWLEKNVDIDKKNVIICNKGIEKYKYGSAEDLLVDDNQDNCDLYNQIGKSVKFENAEQAFKEIVQIINENVQ